MELTPEPSHITQTPIEISKVILAFAWCNDCFEDYEGEHVPRDNHKFDWRKFMVVDNG